MAGVTYRPEIDGLRALAVIPVVLFHLDVAWIGGGYLGVDVFFVISGFLISSIILSDYENNTFSFRRFWERRVRRIVPALMTMLLATSLAGACLLFRGDTVDFGVQGASAALSLANVAMYKLLGNYWGGSALESPFLHTWSLSVEEQFYLFYPLFLVSLLRFARQLAPAALAMVAACSFLLYLHGARVAPVATFYLLHTRAWELACGCLLAVATRGRRPRLPGVVASLLAQSGLVAVIASFVVFSEQGHFEGYLAVPVLGSVLVIAFGGERGSLVARILSLPILVSIGRISYSLYLWHWPVIVIGSQVQLPGGEAPRMRHLLLVLIALSILSYKYVEAPARRAAGPVVLRLCLALLVASLAASLYLQVRSPSYDVSRYSPVTWKGNLYKVNPIDSWDGRVGRRMEGIVAPPRPGSGADLHSSGGVIKRYGGSTPEVVVLGDSLALMWCGVIDSIAEEQGITVSFYAADGTSPFLDPPPGEPKGDSSFTAEQKRVFDRKRLEFIQEWRPKAVVIGASWGMYDIGQARGLVEFCGRVGAQVVLIDQPPILFFGDRNAVQYLASLKVFPQDGRRQYIRSSPRLMKLHAQGLEVIRALCREYPFCQPIPILDLFSDSQGRAWVLDGPQVLYIDDNHLSQEGAERARARIREGLRSAVSRP
jgi:peptidoglycan/LPS O-acetylase OafA/YrhL